MIVLPKVGDYIVIPSTSGSVDKVGRVLAAYRVGVVRLRPEVGVDWEAPLPAPSEGSVAGYLLELHESSQYEMIVRMPMSDVVNAVGSSVVDAAGAAEVWMVDQTRPIIRLEKLIDPADPPRLDAHAHLIIYERVEGGLDALKNQKIDVVWLVPYPNPRVASSTSAQLLRMGFEVMTPSLGVR